MTAPSSSAHQQATSLQIPNMTFSPAAPPLAQSGPTTAGWGLPHGQLPCDRCRNEGKVGCDAQLPCNKCRRAHRKCTYDNGTRQLARRGRNEEQDASMEEDPRGEQDCDLCQEQDILCNNGTPCSNCKRAHRVCTYAAGEVVATHETANRQQFEEHDPVHRRKRQMSGDQYTANNYPNMLAPSAGDESRMFCSEEPHRFNGLVMKGGDLSVGPLLAHSEPIHPCANRSAHRDSEMPHGYGVCTGCRVLAARHIVTTCPELVKYSWLPFCKICGEEKATASQDSHSGTVTPCSCDMKWLCYDCRERELEVRLFKIDDEEQKRQGILGDGDEPEGDVLENGSQTVKMGLSCSCGGSLADGGIVMQCAGCDELRKLPWTWSDVVELFSTQRAHAFKWA